MEIVIENSGEITGQRNHHAVIPSPEYFASLANQRLLTGAELNGSTPTVRRVDRSGLLEMPLPQHHDTTTTTTTTTTTNNNSSTLRRIDRSGLLEPVSEVPDHVAYAKSRLIELNNKKMELERHLTGAEHSQEDVPQGHSSLTLPRYRCRNERRSSCENQQSSLNLMLQSDKKETKDNNNAAGCFATISRAAFDKGGAAAVSGLNHVEQMVARFSPSRTPTPTNVQTQTQGQTTNENSVERLKAKKLEGVARLSPRTCKNDHRVSSPAALSIPDVIEAHEPPTNNADNARTAALLQENGSSNDDSAPEGERAEAEGCEHTAIESLEEARVSFKAQKKIIHNDNIQTLRVIILSEQL